MITKIGVTLTAILLVFLSYVALLPSEYVISREITISATADKIFPYLNNSKLAEQWAPWLELDPEVKMVYSGPDQGTGSRASWQGGKKLGTGSATIVESILNQRVNIKIEYEEPMKMSQDSEYLIRPSSDQSIVTWKVQGQNTFVGRLMCVFMNMDKTVGGMFEKGLSNLKTLVEKNSSPTSPRPTITGETSSP